MSNKQYKQLKINDMGKEIQVRAGKLKVITALSNRYLFHLAKKVLRESSKCFTSLFTSKLHQEVKLSVLKSFTNSLYFNLANARQDFVLFVGRAPTGIELIDKVKLKLGSFCSDFKLTQSSICILSQ